MKKKQVTPAEAADTIQRFLDGTELYPQEWNDFVETRSGEAAVEPFRKRCYELDPLVNSPDTPDEQARQELRNIVSRLRCL